MIDSLISHLDKADRMNVLLEHDVEPKDFGLVTLHRPSNVDDKTRLSRLVQLLKSISEDYRLVFPMHPRTKNNASKMGLLEELNTLKNLKILEPQGYFEFLKLMKESAFVLTDSGGIQEETSYLNIPCITIRDNTERPVTCTMGTNTLVPFAQIDTVESLLSEKLKVGHKSITIPKWDGQTSERIAAILIEKYA
jgi:UDP-N-acetylglucosamine 2-epimerase (non-hydrolysing)